MASPLRMSMVIPSNDRSFADTIIIRDLAAQAAIGEDRWGKVRAQPLRLSIFLQASLIQAGKSDDVFDSIDYGLLCKEILSVVDRQIFHSLYELAETVANHSLTKNGAEAVEVVAEAFNQFLLAESLGVSLSRGRGGIREVVGPDRFFVKDLRIHTIIGVNPCERESKQIVLVNVTFHSPMWYPGGPNWHKLSEKLTKVRARYILSASLNGAVMYRLLKHLHILRLKRSQTKSPKLPVVPMALRLLLCECRNRMHWCLRSLLASKLREQNRSLPVTRTYSDTQRRGGEAASHSLPVSGVAVLVTKLEAATDECFMKVA
jgi:FolB domain-containing protein